jgi:hypothetical protein
MKMWRKTNLKTIKMRPPDISDGLILMALYVGRGFTSISKKISHIIRNNMDIYA